MPKSRTNEINFVGIDREARLVLAPFVAALLSVGKPVDAEYIPLDPRRPDRRLGRLKIGNSGPRSIGSHALLNRCPVPGPSAAVR
jgi:hypothetical protein